MTAARIVGTILVIIGIVALVWGGISWSREKTIVDLGPIEATAETHERIPLPPVVGGVALVAGVVLLVLPARRRV
jgi:UDP-N-acetylmuramyl pentapeptide phosphotransferase/UDP-N-acetylglucosamine-1-phosphate transferase